MLALYTLLGFLLAPYLLEKTLVETMQEDFEASLQIDRIEINPYVLSLRINGLQLDNPDGQPTLRMQEFFVNFQLSSLFRLALTFDEIRFTEPEIFVSRDKSGNFDFDYLVKSSPPAEQPSEEEPTSLLKALIYQFKIENAHLNWSDALPIDPVESRFGPVDISVQELNTLPDRSGQQTVVIATEDSGTLSWSGELQLNPLQSIGRATLEDSRFPVVSSYIRHQSGIEITDGSADLELDYEITTRANGEISAAISNLGVRFNDIVINSFADGTGIDLAGEDGQILKLASINLSGGELRWPEQTFSASSLAIENPQIEVSRSPAGVFSVEPSQVDPPAATAAEPGNSASGSAASANPWQLSLDRFAINDLVLNLRDETVSPAAQLGVKDFDLNIRDISNQANRQFPTELSLESSGGGRVSLKGTLEVLPQPQFDFELVVDALQLRALQPYVQDQANLNLNSGAINLTGKLGSSGEDPLSFRGDFELADLEIAESINNDRLAAWKRFNADRIAFSLAQRQLDISRFRFDQLYGDILIKEDGSLNLGQVQKTAAQPGNKQDDKGATDKDSGQADQTVADGDGNQESEPPLNIRIGQIDLQAASADFADLSLPLPFAVKIDGLNGTMTTISTQSNEPSEVSLEGKVDEFGLARVSGIVTPLDPTKNTDLLVAFDNIDVPSFTPYSIPFAGREIKSGKLDLKLGYEVKDSELAGENSIILRDFELGKEVPHPDALDVPLGLAVALLKDVNGKIDIDLPVRGNVDDPEFSYGGIVLKALGDLLVKIVISPFTALGSALGIDASELENVNFLDGRADLTPPEMEKAGQLAEALALRPELQLTIAGVFDANADGLALRTAALDGLLEQRIAALSEQDPDSQYADIRRDALEQLYVEQLEAGTVTATLDDLRQQNTIEIPVEGEEEPELELDRLAYANSLRDRLIGLQSLQPTDLEELASNRARALQATLIGLNPELTPRVTITENRPISRDADGPIQMEITLTGKSG